MTALRTTHDPSSAEAQANSAAMLERLDLIDAEHAKALAGGGEKYVARHRSRGKLTARERIELLLDRDAPFLELCALAGYGSKFPVGGSVIGGIGTVSGVECLIIANDPTIKGGSQNLASVRKTLRLHEIAKTNRLPLIMLVESGGGDLPGQKDTFIPGGQIFRNLTQLSRAGIPTIAIVFGNSTAGGAYLPGLSDHIIMIEKRSKVFLAGPPLVKAATGEIADDEELGGADMHARVSGLADYLAVDEPDALRLGRIVVSRINWKKAAGPVTTVVREPRHPAEDLLGIVPPDLKTPFDPREVIARIVDDSDFDEFKPLYGSALATGWAQIHGFPVGILANSRGVLFNEEAQKATQFIEMANRYDTPLLFLHNTTGYMVGKEYEQKGIVKHGSMMINAVSNSTVPHLSVLLGASYGAGHYGMCGRAFEPRFVFSWPSARSAVMGAKQLADVTYNVSRSSALAQNKPFDEEGALALRDAIEAQIDADSVPLVLSGLVYDDGVIDPRDTRTVLGLALSAIHTAPVEGTDTFGLFRM